MSDMDTCAKMDYDVEDNLTIDDYDIKLNREDKEKYYNDCFYNTVKLNTNEVLMSQFHSISPTLIELFTATCGIIPKKIFGIDIYDNIHLLYDNDDENIIRKKINNNMFLNIDKENKEIYLEGDNIRLNSYDSKPLFDLFKRFTILEGNSSDSVVDINNIEVRNTYFNGETFEEIKDSDIDEYYGEINRKYYYDLSFYLRKEKLDHHVKYISDECKNKYKSISSHYGYGYTNNMGLPLELPTFKCDFKEQDLDLFKDIPIFGDSTYNSILSKRVSHNDEIHHVINLGLKIGNLEINLRFYSSDNIYSPKYIFENNKIHYSIKLPNGDLKTDNYNLDHLFSDSDSNSFSIKKTTFNSNKSYTFTFKDNTELIFYRKNEMKNKIPGYTYLCPEPLTIILYNNYENPVSNLVLYL